MYVIYHSVDAHTIIFLAVWWVHLLNATYTGVVVFFLVVGPFPFYWLFSSLHLRCVWHNRFVVRRFRFVLCCISSVFICHSFFYYIFGNVSLCAQVHSRHFGIHLIRLHWRVFFYWLASLSQILWFLSSRCAKAHKRKEWKKREKRIEIRCFSFPIAGHRWLSFFFVLRFSFARVVSMWLLLYRHHNDSYSMCSTHSIKPV